LGCVVLTVIVVVIRRPLLILLVYGRLGSQRFRQKRAHNR
jgi:hypothetical protein